MLQTINHSLSADEPISMEGEDFGPSPYDYLSTALAASTTMTLAMDARRKSWDLKEVCVSMSHIPKAYRRYVDNRSGTWTPQFFFRKLLLIGDFDQVQKQRLLEIAEKCPVHKTLSLPANIQTLLLS